LAAGIDRAVGGLGDLRFRVFTPPDFQLQ
jgi:hypothetical protein